MKMLLSSVSTSFRSIDWSSVRGNPLLLAWLLFGTAALLVPSLQWHLHRSSHYNSYGIYVEYEQQQREYEEAQNNNDDGNNNNNNGNNSYYGIYKECGGWNFVCKTQQEKYAQTYFGEDDDGYDDNGNPVSDESIPWWFTMMSSNSNSNGGQSEAMKRWQEENTGQRQEDNDENEAKATVGEILVVSYLMVALLFTVSYGARKLYHQGNAEESSSSTPTTRGIIVALVVVANLLLLNLLLVPSLISVEERDMEDSIYGWYGQVGVLMAYIDFYGLLFCAGFLVLFLYTNKRRNNNNNDNNNNGSSSTKKQENGGAADEETASDDYYTAPSIQMT
jgi:hypothetical protein